jgi:hypothetical protein
MGRDKVRVELAVWVDTMFTPAVIGREDSEEGVEFRDMRMGEGRKWTEGGVGEWKIGFLCGRRG